MKGSIKTAIAALALSALVAGPASAMISKKDIRQSITASLGSGSNVNAVVNGSTVTLTGYYADFGAQNRVLRIVRNTEGVERVIDLATKSN